MSTLRCLIDVGHRLILYNRINSQAQSISGVFFWPGMGVDLYSILVDLNNQPEVRHRWWLTLLFIQGRALTLRVAATTIITFKHAQSTAHQVFKSCQQTLNYHNMRKKPFISPAVWFLNVSNVIHNLLLCIMQYNQQKWNCNVFPSHHLMLAFKIFIIVLGSLSEISEHG